MIYVIFYLLIGIITAAIIHRYDDPEILEKLKGEKEWKEATGSDGENEKEEFYKYFTLITFFWPLVIIGTFIYYFIKYGCSSFIKWIMEIIFKIPEFEIKVKENPKDKKKQKK